MILFVKHIRQKDRKNSKGREQRNDNYCFNEIISCKKKENNSSGTTGLRKQGSGDFSLPPVPESAW